MRSIKTKNIDVVVLCGGLGTRLKGVVDDRPKPMVEIKGRPFLDILVDYISRYGFKRFILCTGYKSSFIEQYYQDKSNGLIFLFAVEKELLGTAGAVKNAESFIENDIFLVLNGDSFCQINIEDFIIFHLDKKAAVSIAVVKIERASDYGVIRLNDHQRIVSFDEKSCINNTGYVNAGMYIFDKTILGEIPAGQRLSLEYDFFPGILDKGIYGYITDERLLDIGTPERLKQARQYFGSFKGNRG